MINWKVRIKNKAFWLALIPAALLFIQACAALAGVKLDLTELQNRLISIVNTLFVLLTVLGVVVDPTTSGIGDSERALTYTDPGDSNRLEAMGR